MLNPPRGRRSYIGRLKSQSIRYQVDPNKVADGSGGGTPTQPEPGLLRDIRKTGVENPEDVYSLIKSLRGENKMWRTAVIEQIKDMDGAQVTDELLTGIMKGANIKMTTNTEAEKQLAEATQKLSALQQEIDKLAQDKADAAKAELVQKEEYKKAWELSEQEKIQLVQKKDQALLGTALRAKALELNIDPRLMPLVNQNGLSVDADGNVHGLEGAFSKMLAENKELVEALNAGKQAQQGQHGQQQQQQQQTDTTNPADKLLIPGTNQTYGDYQRSLSLANGGTPPPKPKGSDNSKPEQPDFSKMTPKEKDQWFKDWQVKQGYKNKK